MATESESGPEGASNADVPAGWVSYTPDAGVLGADVVPLVVDNERLDRDPKVQDAVRRLAKMVDDQQPWLITQYRAALAAAQHRNPYQRDEIHAFIWAYVSNVQEVVAVAARNAGPPDVGLGERFDYLARKALPAGLLPVVPNPFIRTARVIVNRGPQAYPVQIQPGETVVQIAGMTRRDFDDKIAPLITRAQEIHEQAEHAKRRNRGGRQSLGKDPKTRPLALKAAQLRRWDHRSRSDIARLLNVVEPGEAPNEQRVLKRVDNLIKAGDREMTALHGASWQQRREEIEGGAMAS